MRQIEERPWLGFGYQAVWGDKSGWGPFAWISKNAGFQAQHAHNSWLEQWLGMGLLGLVAWGLFYLQTMTLAVIAVFRDQGALLRLPVPGRLQPGGPDREHRGDLQRLPLGAVRGLGGQAGLSRPRGQGLSVALGGEPGLTWSLRRRDRHAAGRPDRHRDRRPDPRLHRPAGDGASRRAAAVSLTTRPPDVAGDVDQAATTAPGRGPGAGLFWPTTTARPSRSSAWPAWRGRRLGRPDRQAPDPATRPCRRGGLGLWWAARTGGAPCNSTRRGRRRPLATPRSHS